MFFLCTKLASLNESDGGHILGNVDSTYFSEIENWAVRMWLKLM